MEIEITETVKGKRK